MTHRATVLSGIILLLGTSAFAQDLPPKVEIWVDYSYARFNPQNNQIIHPFSLNGGGGGAAFFLNRFIGLQVDFQGYSSFNRTILIPLGNPACPATLTNFNPCPVTAQGNMFTYNFGPIFKFRTHHVEPFVEALGGGVHSTFYRNLAKDCAVVPGCVVLSGSPTNNAFDFLVGGGVDIPFGHHFGLRLFQVDYWLTRFGNRFTFGNNNQSSFRAQTGFFFRAGGGSAPPPPIRPPSATCSASPTSVYAGSGDPVSVQASATDPDNHTLTYTWSATGGTVEGTDSRARWNSTGLAVGSYAVTARVDDGHGGTTTCVADIRVEPRPNRPPTMSCSASPTTVHPGDTVRITATASDPDNDPLTYAWQSNGGRVAGSGAEVQLDTTGLAPSHYTVTGRVDDGRGGAADCTVDVTVETPPPPAVEARLAIRSIYFPTALPSPAKPDSGLVESQQRTLTSLANDFKEYLKAKPEAHLLLEGHADPRGTAQFNQGLSERRVEATKQFLIAQGIPESALEIRALGEEKAMSEEEVKSLVEQHPNLTQEQRDRIMKNLRTVTLAQNRRVDITLSSTGQQSVRQFPFNAEDSLTLLSPAVGGGKTRAKPRPKQKQ